MSWSEGEDELLRELYDANARRPPSQRARTEDLARSLGQHYSPQRTACEIAERYLKLNGLIWKPWPRVATPVTEASASTQRTGIEANQEHSLIVQTNQNPGLMEPSASEPVLRTAEVEMTAAQTPAGSVPKHSSNMETHAGASRKREATPSEAVREVKQRMETVVAPVTTASASLTADVPVIDSEEEK